MTRTRPMTPTFSAVAFLFVVLAAPIACTSHAPASAGAVAEVAPARTADFTLEPGDVVRVEIWQEQEKDANKEFRVDERGRLTLPFIGETNATDRPWSEFRD